MVQEQNKNPKIFAMLDNFTKITFSWYVCFSNYYLFVFVLTLEIFQPSEGKLENNVVFSDSDMLVLDAWNF
jgi:hypothetical protein